QDKITGEELLRRPKNKVTLTSAWKATDDLTLSATIYHVGSWEDKFIANNSVPLFAVTGYTTVNLAASYAATDSVTLYGRVDNLFNAEYEVPSGFLRPGIGVFGGIKIAADLPDLIDKAK